MERFKRFDDYAQARLYASELARLCQHDVAIRRTKEYGRWGFNVTLACSADSDYAKAELVAG